jgi:hypothetical protein
MEVVSSELSKVMVGKEKEGERAISVPWCWKAELYSHVVTSNVEPRLRQHSGGEAHGHPLSPGPVCDLSAFPSSEVGLPHIFSKQLSDLSSVGPSNNQF